MWMWPNCAVTGDQSEAILWLEETAVAVGEQDWTMG
jgi:hypothetical protein